MKSAVVQYNSWHTGAGIEWTRRKSYWLEDGEEVGSGRAEGSLAIGDRGQAAVLPNPDVDGTCSGFSLESIQSILLRNKIQWCLGTSSFFFFFSPITDDSVVLDCILNRCCNLCVFFYICTFFYNKNIILKNWSQRGGSREARES